LGAATAATAAAESAAHQDQLSEAPVPVQEPQVQAQVEAPLPESNEVIKPWFIIIDVQPSEVSLSAVLMATILGAFGAQNHLMQSCRIANPILIYVRCGSRWMIKKLYAT